MVNDMKALITGGAGFIGSHLAETLARNGSDVTVFDNFSSGRRKFLRGVKCKIIKADVVDLKRVVEACRGVDVVYHFAADPDVRSSVRDPLKNFETDVVGTVNVLEACRVNNVKKIIFASTSTVYGNAEKIPTPEDSPIVPVSNYGAAKAACENYIMSYSSLYGMYGVILRYANIIGPRLTHGVVYDFYKKLKNNPKELEILGDGRQKKSYFHVRDCLDASTLARDVAKKPFDVFNIGSEEQITVNEIADTIVFRLGLVNVKYRYTGGKVGWKGDVPLMSLSIEKIKKHGWKPRITVRDAIVDTVDWLRKH